MDTWLLWGTPVVIGLQSLGTFLVTPMKLLSFLGTEDFFLLVMPAMVWCVDAALGLRMGLVLLTSASFNSLLKLTVGWPRPYWVSDQVTAYAYEAPSACRPDMRRTRWPCGDVWPPGCGAGVG